MDLNNMMTGLLKDQAIKVIAQKTGLDFDTSKKIASKALPTLLKTLKDNANNPEKKESLEKAVEKNDGSILDNLENIDLEDGKKILWHIFWDKKEEVEKEVWNKWVLEALAPIVMWVLWKANSATWKKASDLLSEDGIIMSLAKSFLDKDNDWEIMDDLMWMAMNFINWKN